jgi:hypothetical protein
MPGKFLKDERYMFANQATWYYNSEDEFHAWLDGQAAALIWMSNNS